MGRSKLLMKTGGKNCPARSVIRIPLSQDRRRMSMRISLAFIIILSLAVGWTKEGKRNSLVKVADKSAFNENTAYKPAISQKARSSNLLPFNILSDMV